MKLLDYFNTYLEFRYRRLNSGRIAPVAPEDSKAIEDLVDAQVARQPDVTMIVTQDQEVTWKEFQTLSYKISNMLASKGVKKGEAVALFMENDILYLACVIGITRLGAVAGLLNTNLVGTQLIHCVREIEANVSLVDGRAMEAILCCEEEYRSASPAVASVIYFGTGGGKLATVGSRTWMQDGALLLEESSAEPPSRPRSILSGDVALYIFTSGTTGLPKAARVTHRKFIYGAAGMAIMGLRAKPTDRLYNCLPLYHGTGLISGAGACFYAGASMFLARRFSASSLIDEANHHHCNLLVYVGEICRYLLNTPERDDDRRCSLERAIGNGLRPDIWKMFRARFGIKRIAEFYGASEANGGFMNAFNKDETIGFTSSTIRLVKYSSNDATVVRGNDGFAIPVPKGEAGLMLMALSERDRFDGYKRVDQSEARLITQAFADGDRWYNSGDVLKEVDVGFAFNIPHYQFVDRLGDTFRWKSENVSTSEVAEILCAYEQVDFACVYGVSIPGTEGRACMVALVLSEGTGQFNQHIFCDFVETNLSSYARPMFIRIRKELEFTGTYKVIKTSLSDEGYDITRVTDPLFYWDSSTSSYLPLTREQYREFVAGRSGH